MNLLLKFIFACLFNIPCKAHVGGDESHKRLRYKLGELLCDTTDHLLILTVTPYNAEL